MRGAILAVGVAVLCGGTAWAEERSPYPTSFSVVGGLTAGTSQTVGRQLFGLGDAGEGSGFAVGGDIAHDLSPRLTFELTGLYMDRSSNAWSVDTGLRLNFRPTSESVVPYFAVSGLAQACAAPSIDISIAAPARLAPSSIASRDNRASV